jgi:hypothetical protein
MHKCEMQCDSDDGARLPVLSSRPTVAKPFFVNMALSCLLLHNGTLFPLNYDVTYYMIVVVVVVAAARSPEFSEPPERLALFEEIREWQAAQAAGLAKHVEVRSGESSPVLLLGGVAAAATAAAVRGSLLPDPDDSAWQLQQFYLTFIYVSEQQPTFEFLGPLIGVAVAHVNRHDAEGYVSRPACGGHAMSKRLLHV